MCRSRCNRMVSLTGHISDNCRVIRALQDAEVSDRIIDVYRQRLATSLLPIALTKPCPAKV